MKHVYEVGYTAVGHTYRRQFPFLWKKIPIDCPVNWFYDLGTMHKPKWIYACNEEDAIARYEDRFSTTIEIISNLCNKYGEKFEQYSVKHVAKQVVRPTWPELLHTLDCIDFMDYCKDRNFCPPVIRG